MPNLLASDHIVSWLGPQMGARPACLAPIFYPFWWVSHGVCWAWRTNEVGAELRHSHMVCSNFHAPSLKQAINQVNQGPFFGDRLWHKRLQVLNCGVHLHLITEHFSPARCLDQIQLPMLHWSGRTFGLLPGVRYWITFTCIFSWHTLLGCYLLAMASLCLRCSSVLVHVADDANA